jgi:hypothetical protein
VARSCGRAGGGTWMGGWVVGRLVGLVGLSDEAQRIATLYIYIYTSKKLLDCSKRSVLIQGAHIERDSNATRPRRRAPTHTRR